MFIGPQILFAFVPGAVYKKQQQGAEMSVTSWFLVNSGGTRHRLPREMIFVGRDDCELMLQVRTLHWQESTTTFVNDVRIQEQMYITLKLEDKLRFGYDILSPTLWSLIFGLQLSKKPSNGQTTAKATTSNSPSKTPTKTPKSPSTATPKSVERRVIDGVTSSRDQSAKPVDSHKADERIGDRTRVERQKGVQRLKTRTKKGTAGSKDLTTLQAAMMASESKVADWLAHNDPTLVRSESTEDDSKTIKSDVPVHLKRLKVGSKHEDGTQSDSENGLGLRFANHRHALEERLKAAQNHLGGGAAGTTTTVTGTRTTGSRTAFMIEFYDEENPRKRRSYSFSQTAPLLGGGVGGEGLCPQPPSHPKVFSISTSAASAADSGSDAFESAAPPLGKGESTSSLTDRKRRTLPQLPVDDPRAKSSPKALRSEIGEKQDTEPQEKENKGDGESPPPMEGGEMPNKRKQSSTTSSPSKAPVRTTERRKRSEERNGGEADGEKSGKPLVRQGSFTIEKPSSSVPTELIPRINRGNNGRERSDSVGSMDTATLLKDTEAVMAFLEAKLRDENKLDQKSAKTSLGTGPCPPVRTESISPESDVDTASTASHAAAEAGGKTAAGSIQKRRSLSSMHREKSNMSTASKTTSGNASARERLERKAKGRTAEATTRTDARRSTQPSSASSKVRQPSLDLTDDDQTSSFPISDILSSDQETYSGPLGNSAHRQGSEDILHSKLDSRSSKTSTSGASKTSRNLQAATASSLSKQTSLPQPRPTRASLLRRARLGDTSDTDLADADRVSVASEVSTTSSTSKPPTGRKGMSRLDMLAQPRRTRLGSISARSDSECTVSRPSTSSTRLSAETALRLGLRSSTPTENRLTSRMRANSVSKLNEPKAKTTTSGYCSPTGEQRNSVSEL
ncbi:hypothetical protein XENOCAPTIV_000232 [Xenoophorus captivus]|uniref:CEP170 C-terminal domain-containing protein n=1 Tax=Xenoophorus captivus TaxID=1517983 RepID=A0ABV0QTW9_9TELE